MALVFSDVSMEANGDHADILVGGSPNCAKDMMGWLQFERFLHDHDCPISISVNTRSYGEGEPVDADAYEIAYLLQRLRMQPDFLKSRTQSLLTKTFSVLPEKDL